MHSRKKSSTNIVKQSGTCNQHGRNKYNNYSYGTNNCNTYNYNPYYKRYALAVLLFLSLLMLSACGSVGPNPGNPTFKNYNTGTTGLDIVFFKSNLKEVYEDETIPRALYLYNKGSYTLDRDVQKGKLSITYDEYYLRLAEESPTGKILEIPPPENIDPDGMFWGKSINAPLGDEEYFEYVFKIQPLNNLRDTMKTTINYQLCFPYHNELTISTCIDTKKYTYDQAASVCKQTTYSSGSGQGGPVAVVKVVPDISLYKTNIVRPQFKIYIQNKGEGYIVDSNGTEVCSAANVAKRASNLGVVRVSAELSGRPLTCYPGTIKVKSGGDNMAKCYVSDEDTQYYTNVTRNFVAPLTVKVDYGYVIIEKEEITIKRLQDINKQEAEACGYYEYHDGTKCISLCEYCKNPAHINEKICQDRIKASGSSSTFAFDKDFSCQCSKSKCLALKPDGHCILGFCSGDSYCCDEDECRDKEDGAACQVVYTCKNHKCDNTTSQCKTNFGAKNYTCMAKSECDSTTIHTGQCPPVSDPNIVCCLKNDCKGKPDGAFCGDHYTCSSGRCDLTLNQCDALYATQNYGCMPKSQCDVTKKRPEALCPSSLGANYACCARHIITT